MDNTQRRHLRLQFAAMQRALQEGIKFCLDTCFELRLEPDLALYIRPSVCLMICGLSHPQTLPEKVEIAKKAVRLAEELKMSMTLSTSTLSSYLIRL